MLKNKLLLVIAALALAGGAAAWLLVLHPHQAAAAGKHVAKPVMVNVPEVTTNLSDSHFVQADLTLDLDGSKAAALYQRRQAAIRDRIIATLRGSTSAQLRGGKGMHALGAALAQAIDGGLGAKDVLHVYFTKLVVQ